MPRALAASRMPSAMARVWRSVSPSQMMKKSASVLFLRRSMSTTSLAFFDSAASRTSRTNCRDVIRRDYCTGPLSLPVEAIFSDIQLDRGREDRCAGSRLSQQPPDRGGRDGGRGDLQHHRVWGQAEVVQDGAIGRR